MFIDEQEIEYVLDKAENSKSSKAARIISKAKELKGLSAEETAVLLQCKDKKITDKIFKTAKQLKERIYGKRLVLFAPLYITNECSNNCLYCGFRKDNKELQRKTLTINEVREEVKILEKLGYKRLLLVYADNNNLSIDYITNTIKTVYETKKDKGDIRRVNVNFAPVSVSDFKKVKEIGIGTYQLFQETYHRQTYKKMHPSGKKMDYNWRLYAMDRAQKAGIDDNGLGVLFGLYDWKSEVLALLYHALHLEERFGVGPHTISFPRIEPALNAPVANNPPCPVSDLDFKKLVAILRLAVPYTGLILTTRETVDLRREVFSLGVSQISAGSRTYPGAYKDLYANKPDKQQFSLSDTRPLDVVIKDIAELGFIPSFCTACYRLGRTGKDFMSLAKPGLIKNFCLPNALLTFKEYLEDYASNETKEVGSYLIKRQINEIKNKEIKAKTIERLKQIETSEIAICNLPASARSKKAISECAQEHAPGFSPAVLDKGKRDLYF